ncbi:MAG: hypothetical protein AB9828_06235 [Sphaerochaetaceae bacterium]
MKKTILALSFLVLIGSPVLLCASSTDWQTLLQPNTTLGVVGTLKEPLAINHVLRSALIVSGVVPEHLETYETDLRKLLDTLAQTTLGSKGTLARAEAALVALHSLGILKTYDPQATTLKDILDTGRYNCVSSAVLYLLVLKHLGIQSMGVTTADHVFCLVPINQRKIDVETTNRYGFDPGTKKEFFDEFGRVTGFTYVPQTEYGRRETIGEKALIALILTNRVVVLEEQGLYREALALGVQSYALQNDTIGKAFLLDRIGNMIVALNKQGAYGEAYDLANAVLGVLGATAEVRQFLQDTAGNLAISRGKAGDLEAVLEVVSRMVSQGFADADLQETADITVHNRIQILLTAGDVVQARQALEQALQVLDGERLREASVQVLDAELVQAVHSQGFEKAFSTVSQAAEKGILKQTRIDEMFLYLFTKETNRLAATKDWLAAATIAIQGLEQLPQSTQLAQAAEGYRRNFIVQTHNEFANLFNARQYVQAKEVVWEALQLVPEEPTLESDLATVWKILGD